MGLSRGRAIERLIDRFQADRDYQRFTLPVVGRSQPLTEYRLSPACFETFIAHPLPPLGLIYRRCFGLEPESQGHQGQQLLVYLERSGINQTELAQRLGRSKSTVSSYLQSRQLTGGVRRAVA